ncbi:hypothetical protein ACIQUM_07695 [Amycolatopsis azurea]|uniref:hypothetical protein n=1 Tax=Amycolatopsis azurea TaxID=36819 RepID=UPI00382E3C7B
MNQPSDRSRARNALSDAEALVGSLPRRLPDTDLLGSIAIAHAAIGIGYALLAQREAVREQTERRQPGGPAEELPAAAAADDETPQTRTVKYLAGYLGHHTNTLATDAAHGLHARGLLATPVGTAAGRVFLAGDTVPGDIALIRYARTTGSLPTTRLSEARGVSWTIPDGSDSAYIEICGLPSSDDCHAIVESARSERDLRRHLASRHKNAAAFDVPASDLEDIHRHDHTAPGGIRDHDISDRTYDEATVRAVIDEARED